MPINATDDSYYKLLESIIAVYKLRVNLASYPSDKVVLSVELAALCSVLREKAGIDLSPK